MRQGEFAKLQKLDDRHPGLWRKVDAMFERFATITEITAEIEKQYGERISRTSIWNYKRKCWRPWQDQLQIIKAEQIALHELATEERS